MVKTQTQINNMTKIKNDDGGILELFTGGGDLAPEANLQLADPQLVNYYSQLKNRTIWLTKEIDESLFEESKLILQWNREDEENNIPVAERKPIKVLLHSYGGDLFSCRHFTDILDLSKTKVITVNIACAMSAGALIYISGHERYCFKNSTALLHLGSSSQGSTSYNDAQEANKSWKKMVEDMKQMILERTKISKQLLGRKMKSDWYITSEEQLQYGLCDKIVDDMSMIL